MRPEGRAGRLEAVAQPCGAGTSRPVSPHADGRSGRPGRAGAASCAVPARPKAGPLSPHGSAPAGGAGPIAPAGPERPGSRLRSQCGAGPTACFPPARTRWAQLFLLPAGVAGTEVAGRRPAGSLAGRPGIEPEESEAPGRNGAAARGPQQKWMAWPSWHVIELDGVA